MKGLLYERLELGWGRVILCRDTVEVRVKEALPSPSRVLQLKRAIEIGDSNFHSTP